MRVFIIAAAILLVFIGSLVYFKNRAEEQRQFEIHARQAAARDARKGANANDSRNSVQEGSQSSTPNALLGLDTTTPGEDLACATKALASIQRCLAHNNIQNGSDEAGVLIALSRKGHAEFLGIPHEKDGKCHVDIRITGKYSEQDIDKLLKDCEVE